MKNKFPALVLTGAVLLSLAACGGKPAESPTPAPSAPAATDTPAPAPTPEATPTQAPQVSAVPSEEPVQSQPVQTPEPEPENTPAASALTAQDVYAAVYAAAGGNSTMDASAYMDAFYNLTADDLADHALYMPEMSVNIEEIFIARAKDGKLDAVKAACELRQKGMAEDAEFYPATGAYVADYQLVTNGDWVMFCVCENYNDAVTAFNDAVK